VSFHGSYRDAEDVGDFFGNIPLCNKLQDLLLPFGQLLIEYILPGLFCLVGLHQISGDFRRHVGFSLHHAVYGGDEFTRGGTLDDITGSPASNAGAVKPIVF
jgi:hypothetical protein